jgi:hypothetical protein
MAIAETYANFVTPAGGLDDGSSEVNAWETPASMAAGAVAGDRVNMRFTSRYTVPSSQTFAFAGSVTQPILIRGYETTIGDGGKILLHFATGTIYTWLFSGDNVLSYDWDITHSGGGASTPFGFQSDGGFVRSLQFVSDTTGTLTDVLVRLDDCGFGSLYVESAGNTSSGEIAYINRTFGTSIVTNSVNGRAGVDIGQGYRANSIGRILAYSRVSTTARGLYVTGGDNSSGMYIGQLTIHGFDESLTYDVLQATIGNAMVVDNAILSGAVYGLSIDDATNKCGAVFNNIFFYDCTNQTNGFGDNTILNPIALTADPFVDSSAYDFNLNYLAGGGALVRAAVEIGAGVIESYLDSGALQSPIPKPSQIIIGI